MTEKELLKIALELLAKVYNDTRSELKIRLAIPQLMREYAKIQEKEL